MSTGKANYLDAFIKTAQYLAGLTTQQDVWSETGKLLVNFWGADLGGFGERQSNDEIAMHHLTFSAELSNRIEFASELREDIAAVLDSGFLTWRCVSSSPEPLVVAYLPLTQENQVTKVLLVGHRNSGSIPKDLLNGYLALAGLVGTTAGRLASEVDLRKHRQRLEEKTEELVKTNSQLKGQIAKRKEAEATLKQTLADLTRSNEDLQQFAYVSSHDLQEPLRNVTSCLQLLEQKYRNKLDADADQYINYAVEGAVRMKSLILDLLAYSRIGTTGKPIQPVDCEQVLVQAMENLTSTVTEAAAAITHDPLPSIPADDTQLLQVFQNLIGNAIKFRRDVPPRIHVSAEKNSDEWIFSVKDNGIGIKPQYLEKIFVIFQRLNKRSQYDGTGVGLAIVKKVVERHGGRVWVESEPGIGTTFYFAIPERTESNIVA